MHDAFWQGLWASGWLTARDYRRWSPAIEDDQDGLEAAFAGAADTPIRLPDRWVAVGASGLRDRAKRGFDAMQRAMEAAIAPVRILESARLHPDLHSPFVGVVGSVPPSSGLLAVVGTRRLSAGDDAQLNGWLRPIVRAVGGIVSGGAMGVDALAHRLALDEGVPTWAVLAGGAEAPTPKANRALFDAMVAQGGGWISERPPGYSPRDYDFLERNRVIAQLSSAVLVARAPARSGALSTAREARARSVPVGAIPGAPDVWNAEGCNQLIVDGAALVRGASDLPRLGFLDAHTGSLFDAARHEPPACMLSDDEHGALRAYLAWEGEGKGWIAQDAGRHQEVLLDLELAGLLHRDLAGHYALTPLGRRCKNHG